MSALADLLAQERRRQGRLLLTALAAGGGAAIAAVALLGLSGWFITGAALAGVSGASAVAAFNYLTPSATIRLLAIGRTGLRYFERVAGHEAALRALAALRPKLFTAIAAAPVDRALALSGGEASARLVQDVDALETRFVRLPAHGAAVAALLFGLAIITLVDWRGGLALAAFAALQAVAVQVLARRFEHPAAARLQPAAGELKDTVAALVAAGPQLAAYGLEDWAAETVDAKGRALAAAGRAADDARGRILLVQAVISGLGVVAVALTCANRPPPLLALALLTAVVTLETLGGALRALVREGEAEEAERRLAPLFDGAATQTAGSVTEVGVLGRRLVPGARLALAGPSGCGKTRLIETLVGLRGAGDAAGRARFAYMPQDAAMLAGTVRENLKLGDTTADDAALWEALEDAALADHVRALPGRLDAWVGEGGARLSGGQRRRLALARAYLRDAPILLLDEPTEGLDAATEAEVLARLVRRLDRTGQGLVLASHRSAATALCSERIMVGGDAREPTASGTMETVG